MKKILNYYELKAMYVEFQERITEAEGVEKVELQREYEKWRNEYGIVQYTKAWGCDLYGICPICDKKECECPAEEIEVVYEVEPEEDEE